MPPKKKALSDSEKNAKLKEIEERRKAIEAERLKKEQEMQALLAEQEELQSKLALVDDEVEEGELGTTTEESASVTMSDVASVPASEPSLVKPEAPVAKTEHSESVSEPVSEPAADPVDASLPSEEPLPTAAVLDTPTEQKPPIEATKLGMTVTDEKYSPFANRLFGNLYKERETKFFIVKSANRENLEMAFDHNVWATTSVNEIRWNEAFMAHTNVLLVFSMQASGAFQGIARISSKSSTNSPAGVTWSIPPNLTAEKLKAVFQIDWISRQELPFDKLTHLRNTWNRNKLVKVARDGQEVSWKTGCALAKLFPLDGSCAYDQLIGKMKRKRSEIGPKQAVTSSSRSAKRRKNHNKPSRTAVGINPSGYKRPNPGYNRGGGAGGPAAKRQRTGGAASGANTAPLGNKPTTTKGITNLFNLST